MCIQEKHIKCPVCYMIYGIMTGDQPEGTMHHKVNKKMKCDGYHDCGTIVIDYKFPDG